MIDNIPRIFTTQPPGGANPSRYYVYRDGLIRVKMANRTVSISPRKNIAFVDDWGQHGDQVVFRPTHFEFFGEPFAYPAMLQPDSGNQYAGVGRRPVDFYLNAVGFLAPRPMYHRGHQIAAEFAGRINGRDVDPAKLDLYIQKRFGFTNAQVVAPMALQAVMSNNMIRIITS